MASRRIADLVPDLQPLAEKFAARMAEAGLPFIFTCTRRSQEEQDVLYEQGRTTPGRKVTWTRKSKHITGEAFDIAIAKDGVPVWDLKADVDMDGALDYYEAGIIGEDLGLVWGGRFLDKKGRSNPDFPHFELRRGK